MLILVGASASGKTEISHILKTQYGMDKAVTHTTRMARPNERDGIDYYFVSKERFLMLAEKGFFVETTEYGNNLYGCGKNQIDDDKVVIVDPHGFHSFKALENSSIIAFYLEAKPETRRNRMILRGDKPEDIEHRLKCDKVDFTRTKVKGVDFIIKTDNKTLEKLADEIYDRYVKTLLSRGYKPNLLIAD